MENKKLYFVYQILGSYEDRCQEDLAIFDSLEKAEEYKEKRDRATTVKPEDYPMTQDEYLDLDCGYKDETSYELVDRGRYKAEDFKKMEELNLLESMEYCPCDIIEFTLNKPIDIEENENGKR